MLEKATALVVSYDLMIIMAIAAFGILTATVWTVVKKQQGAKPSEPEGL